MQGVSSAPLQQRATVYCARDGQTVILLLCGGDKYTEQADLVLRLFFTLYQKIPSSLKSDMSSLSEGYRLNFLSTPMKSVHT